LRFDACNIQLNLALVFISAQTHSANFIVMHENHVTRDNHNNQGSKTIFQHKGI
jgi:hypothetical protein